MTTTAMPAPELTFDNLLAEVSSYLNDQEIGIIRAAYEMAERGHAGVLRKSGEPYIQHPLAVALILATMKLDPATMAAALLHDLIEDTRITYHDIQEAFGTTVANLVNGVTKFSAYEAHRGSVEDKPDDEETRKKKNRERLRWQQAETVRKMFIAMAEDPRVVIVKLADRLHNMRTLSVMTPDKQQSISLETREIYAPLAGRLGIGAIKTELEDLAFRYLDPENYYWVARQVHDQRLQRQSYIERVSEVLRDELATTGMQAEVKGRPKHLWSIFRKLQKTNMDINLVYDLFAFRILVPDLHDCYVAMGVVHSLWRPKDSRIKDYIAVPKVNGYQSLHTTVFCLDGKMAEIQIRTNEMHRIAENGVATHWYYKERGQSESMPTSMVSWIRQLVEWQRELSQTASEFVDSVKGDVFQDQIFVFTPQGDVKDMPAGSTPLDFAYRIHTEVGNSCSGARVTGSSERLVPRMVPLNHQLQSGEIIEIQTSKLSHPTRDWLNIARTANAKGKIRQYLKRQDRSINLAIGRDLFDRELRHLAGRPLQDLNEDDLQWVCAQLGYEHADDLIVAISYDEASPHQAAIKLAQHWKALAPPEPPAPPAKEAPATQTGPSTVHVQGIEGLLCNLARCCRPLPGDEILGYITVGRGVSVHRADCVNVARTAERLRLVAVEWGRVGLQAYQVPVRILGFDRPGLLKDVLNAVAEDKINLTAAKALARPDHTAVITATMEIKNLDILPRIFAHLGRVKDVYSVERDKGVTGAAPGAS